MAVVRTNSDGNYTAEVRRSALAPFVNPNGIVNMLARAMTGDMTRTYGFWLRTTKQGRYRPMKATTASFRMIRSAAPMPSVSSWLAGTRATAPNICVIGSSSIDGPDWTSVGETSIRIHGTDSKQQFTYQWTESSSLGVAFSQSGDMGTWSASDSNSKSTTSTIPFAKFQDNISRRYKTEFQWERLNEGPCGDFTTPDKYIGGGQNPSQDAPAATHCASYLAGSSPSFQTSNAIMFSAAATIPEIGFSVTGQTGWDTNGFVQYFMGSSSHDACGQNDVPGGNPKVLDLGLAGG